MLRKTYRVIYSGCDFYMNSSFLITKLNKLKSTSFVRDSPVFIVFDKLDKIGRKTLNSVIALAIKAGRLDLVRYFVVPGVLLYNAVPKKRKEKHY